MNKIGENDIVKITDMIRTIMSGVNIIADGKKLDFKFESANLNSFDLVLTTRFDLEGDPMRMAQASIDLNKILREDERLSDLSTVAFYDPVSKQMVIDVIEP